MKTYKTWEVVKMMSENNKLEFKPIGEGLLVNTIGVNEHGIIEFI